MGRLKRWLIGTAIILILVVAAGIFVFWKDIQEIRGAMDYASTFDPDTIVENFRSLYKKYPSSTVLRDYARFGLLYLNQGRNFEGQQLVSADWVKASVTPDAPHLMPGRDNPGSDWPMGYGYQWWIPENPQGDYTAIGIYGQFIYVHPAHNVVIAKTSAYVDYDNSGDEMEFESVEAFRAIAKGL